MKSPSLYLTAFEIKQEQAIMCVVYQATTQGPKLAHTRLLLTANIMLTQRSSHRKAFNLSCSMNLTLIPNIVSKIVYDHNKELFLLA